VTLPPTFRTVGPPPPPVRKSRLVAIVLTIFCGALLAGGSCFGLAINFDGHGKTINTLLVCGMIAGAVAFLAGIIWAIVAIVLHILRSRSQQL
jgi:hypothetical protein